MKSWYKILGVSQDASPEEVTSAYRIKVKEAHPDNQGDAQDFQRIKQAYDYYNHFIKQYKVFQIEQEQKESYSQPLSQKLVEELFIGYAINNNQVRINTQFLLELLLEYGGEINSKNGFGNIRSILYKGKEYSCNLKLHVQDVKIILKELANLLSGTDHNHFDLSSSRMTILKEKKGIVCEKVDFKNKGTLYNYRLFVASSDLNSEINLTIKDNKASLSIEREKKGYGRMENIGIGTFRKINKDVNLYILKNQIAIAAKNGIDISSIPKSLQPPKVAITDKSSHSINRPNKDKSGDYSSR